MLNWLGSCRVSAIDGESNLPPSAKWVQYSRAGCVGCDTLTATSSIVLDERYSQAAVGLLERVGYGYDYQVTNIEAVARDSLLT